jgi:hypothetical protein
MVENHSNQLFKYILVLALVKSQRFVVLMLEKLVDSRVRFV